MSGLKANDLVAAATYLRNRIDENHPLTTNISQEEVQLITGVLERKARMRQRRSTTEEIPSSIDQAASDILYQFLETPRPLRLNPNVVCFDCCTAVNQQNEIAAMREIIEKQQITIREQEAELRGRTITIEQLEGRVRQLELEAGGTAAFGEQLTIIRELLETIHVNGLDADEQRLLVKAILLEDSI